MAKISELRVGDTLIADGGFTCLKPGARVVVRTDGSKPAVPFADLFIVCEEGRHYLNGQENESGDLVGLSPS